MPRKHRAPASAPQNRENQRRFRARHREFVEDLQRRLLEYERRGVQATVEMQLASRAVAAENAALRTLLSERGVSHGEVEAYLCRSSPSCSHGTDQVGMLSSAREISGALSQLESRTPLLQQLSDSLSGPCVANPEGGYIASHASSILSTNDSHQSSPADAHMHQLSPRMVISTSFKTPEESGSVIHPETHPSEDRSRESSNAESSTVTPCEEAAAILAQLRGRTDVASARFALGCSETSQCLIKNSDLMLLVDQIP